MTITTSNGFSQPILKFSLDRPTISCRYFDEPTLLFGNEGADPDPKRGMSKFGPYTVGQPRSHRANIRVGVIGSGDMVQDFYTWLGKCRDLIAGEGPDLPDFPGIGLNTGFAFDVITDDGWNELLTRSELKEIGRVKQGRLQFEAALSLLEDKVRLISERDAPPDVIVLALPPEWHEKLGSCDYEVQIDGKRAAVHRDLRRCFKARAMRYRIPTQIVLRRTLVGGRDVDHPAKCAWNFFTGLYFKSGGVPWVLRDVVPGTCYVGVSFFHDISDSGRSVRTSLAQAFDESGNGLVLRGQKFPWDPTRDGRSPHLSSSDAKALIEMVLERYRREVRNNPKRIVVHKSSEFWADERDGFEQALSGLGSFDLVSVQLKSDVRLLRSGLYPPLRGTSFTLGQTHYLYTTGYVPALKAYPHGHVPSPLQLTDHVGDSSPEQILSEILALSKMNWNSADMGGSLPITLRFSRLVGDILREVAQDEEPHPSFKFYM